MKPKLILIHGGMTFKNQKDYLKYLKEKEPSFKKKKRWFDHLEKKLSKKFDIARPRMPLQDNAKYSDWKILFDNFLPCLDKNSILIGNSLGGIFLAKYLSENPLPIPVKSTYLVCPPFDNTLLLEDLAGGFDLKQDLSLMQKNTKNLTLIFSKDDDVVPVSHAKKYKQKLPKAKFIIFKSKNGHFKIQKFPELLKMIKQDLK